MPTRTQKRVAGDTKLKPELTYENCFYIETFVIIHHMNTAYTRIGWNQMMKEVMFRDTNYRSFGPLREKTYPVSILHKSIAGRYQPVRVADGLITDRCRFIKNASWVRSGNEGSNQPAHLLSLISLRSLHE